MVLPRGVDAPLLVREATREDAAAYAAKILEDAYRAFMVDILAMPVLVGIKPSYDRFAGAINTLACEGMMRDGKALQMGTSHELGQNFAKAFDIGFLDADSQQQLCWTTSWGTSTRMVGGLIMTHGDDNGLRVPPVLAPIQALDDMVVQLFAVFARAAWRSVRRRSQS